MAIQDGTATDGLTIAIDAGIATLTIDRPDKTNAITQAMWPGIREAVEALRADTSVRVLVLKGAGAHFSAGADIAEFDRVRGDARSALAYEAANVAAFAAVRETALPTVAAIRGACMGGGFGLAAACDMRIAAPEAVFAVPAARLGLAYPHEAMRDIVHAAGPQMARYLTFTGARIGAPAALACGFLLEVVDKGRFDTRLGEIATAIAANAPLSLRASKLSIEAVLGGSAETGERARVAGERTFDSTDYAEGRAAFRQKRQPRFAGC